MNNPIKSTINAYDRIAQHYKQCWGMNNIMESQIQIFIEQIPPKARVLDIGCGVGQDSLSLGRNNDISVVGIDLSSHMLEYAQKSAPLAIFCKIDARKLAFLNKSFDGIWANASLLHIPKKEMSYALDEIYRVLRDFGTVFISLQRGEGEIIDPDGRLFVRYTQEEVNQLLEHAGFYVIYFEENTSLKNTYGESREIYWMRFFIRKKFTSKLYLGKQLVNFPQNCPLCIKNGLYLYKSILPQISIPDLLLIKGENFFVLPDISPIIEGHILIVSNDHITSVADLQSLAFQELNLLMKQLSIIIFKLYSKPAIFFEHGSRGIEGCGASIHHAHMHCLPISENIITHLYKWIPIFSVNDIYELQSVTKGMPYFFFQRHGKPGQVGILTQKSSNIPSQYLRQIAAFELGEDEWDWRSMVSSTFRQKHNISKIYATIKKIKKLLYVS